MDNYNFVSNNFTDLDFQFTWIKELTKYEDQPINTSDYIADEDQ